MYGNERDIQVLSLEDDDLDAELVRERLLGDGLHVLVRRARTEAEYRAELEGDSIDVILSDFSLPGYGGLEALAAARSTVPDVPFIFVSGAIGEERAIETLRRGATDYVLKNRMQRLTAAVVRALEATNERRKRREAETERDRLLVSERQARQSAETANRMKDEFLAIVSHELRTPLNAILGWATLLASGEADRENLAKGLATIERNARIQARLIEDILDISRIVTGKLQLRIARASIPALVSAAADAMRLAAGAKSITLTIDVADAGEIEADVDRLQQVMWNLLSNAVKFTPPGGKISVTATRGAQSIDIEVIDTGEGIDPTFLPHVFEHFRQADATVTRPHGGLGLGLAIVRHLVELHGGTATAESAGPGEGSCFRIHLPAGRAFAPEDGIVSKPE